MEIERNIARTETWYLGDGWYTDGYEGRNTARNIDWYAGWAMNFYPLWYCRISGTAADPTLLPRYRDRLARYLATAQGQPYGLPMPGTPNSYFWGANSNIINNAFWAWSLFSAWSKTADCSDSITWSVTSSPRNAGRQCMKMAFGAAKAISSEFT